MPEKYRISNLLGKINDEDRNTLGALLLKAGYCVKIGKEKVGSKNQTRYYVEYWQDKEERGGQTI